MFPCSQVEMFSCNKKNKRLNVPMLNEISIDGAGQCVERRWHGGQSSCKNAGNKETGNTRQTVPNLYNIIRHNLNAHIWNICFGQFKFSVVSNDFFFFFLNREIEYFFLFNFALNRKECSHLIRFWYYTCRNRIAMFVGSIHDQTKKHGQTFDKNHTNREDKYRSKFEWVTSVWLKCWKKAINILKVWQTFVRPVNQVRIENVERSFDQHQNLT